VVVAGAGATQLLRGEVTQLDLGQLFAPFLFISLPAMAVVATVAVLFEVIPFLQGGFGNLAYFVLYIVTIIVSMSGVTFTEQGVIEAPINDLFGASVIGASMLGEAHAAYPQRQLDFGIGYAKIEGPIETFRWVGVTWTAGIAAQRLVWVGVALGIALLAALIFDRFDPARLSRRGRKGQGLLACLTAPSPRPRGRIWAMLRSIRLPRLNLARFITLPAWPLPPFARVLVAELRLALKGLRWWWYAVALGLIVAGATRPAPEALNLLPIAWIWPVLLWSEFGVREARHHTGPVVFSTPHPLQRQFPAMWVAGVLVSVLCGSGVALRLLLAGEMMHLLAWVVAALFIPTLALTAGVWSGSSKLFEALYVVLWYLGPVSGLAALDFMGTTPGSLAQGMPWIYLGITAALLGLAYVGRARMLKH